MYHRAGPYADYFTLLVHLILTTACQQGIHSSSPPYKQGRVGLSNVPAIPVSLQGEAGIQSKLSESGSLFLTPATLAPRSGSQADIDLVSGTLPQDDVSSSIKWELNKISPSSGNSLRIMQHTQNTVEAEIKVCVSMQEHLGCRAAWWKRAETGRSPALHRPAVWPWL